MANFALIGAGGYIAPRHLAAIQATGNVLVAATDPHDTVGTLDRYFPDALFFRDINRFDRFLQERRHLGEAERIHYVSVCSPNYLHDAHVRLALRSGANVICEKPLAIEPHDLDTFETHERDTGARVFNVLQLRLLPALNELKARLAGDGSRRHRVELTYVTSRGPWYFESWKGDAQKSGGIVTNIGVHFFDFLMWVFGAWTQCEVHLSTRERMAGTLELERATVSWYLSLRRVDLPAKIRAANGAAFRSITIDGEELEFSDGFTELHTKLYQEMLAGRGFGIADARPAINLTHALRMSPVVTPNADAHSMVKSATLAGTQHA